MAKAKIVLICAGGRHEEAIGSGAIKPGHLLRLTNSAGAERVAVHNVEGGFAERLFAVEDALQGRTVDDAYANAERVSYRVAAPGEEVYAYIKAGSTAVAIGDQLISAGDGTLIPVGDAGTEVTNPEIVAVAREAIDLTDTGDVDTRIAVRVAA